MKFMTYGDDDGR